MRHAVPRISFSQAVRQMTTIGRAIGSSIFFPQSASVRLPLQRRQSLLSSSSSLEDDAAETKAALQKPERARAIAAGDKSTRVPGAIALLFTQIQGVSGSLRSINEAIGKAQAGSAEETALLKEKEALSGELKRLMSSSTLAQFSQIASGVQSSLQSGVSGEMMGRVLQSRRGLVGDGFISAVQSGDIFTVQGASDAASQLVNLGAQDFVAASKLLDSIHDSASRGASALAYSGTLQSSESEILPVIESQNGSVPVPTILTFDLPGSISMQMTTYTGADLINAIKAHALPDAKDLVHLIVDSPDPEEEEKKRKERENRLCDPLW